MGQLFIVAILLGQQNRPAPCFVSTQSVLPSNATRNVPQNTVIRIFGNDVLPSEITLQQIEPFKLIPLDLIASSTSLELRLKTKLDPNTEYLVSTPSVTSSFKTGAYDDDQSPSKIQIDSSVRSVSSVLSRTKTETLTLSISGLSDDSTPNGDLWLEAFLNTNGAGYEPLPSVGFLSSAPSVFWGSCGGNFDLSNASDIEVKLRVIDWAGNISEASPPKRLKSCGCSSAELFFGLAVLSFWRRKTKFS